MCSCWHRVSSASTWSWLGSLVWMFVFGVWAQWTLDIVKLVTATDRRFATSLPYCRCDRQTVHLGLHLAWFPELLLHKVFLCHVVRGQGRGSSWGRRSSPKQASLSVVFGRGLFPAFLAAFWEGTDLEVLLSPDQASDSLQPPDARGSPFILSKVDWVGATDNEEIIVSSQDFQIVASGPRSGTFFQLWQALTVELTVSVCPCSQLCQQVPSLWII